MSTESRSNTSSSAQPQTLTQSRVQQAHRDYAIQIATEVGNEMEAEYAKKVPEYNKRREWLFGRCDEDETRDRPYNGEAFQQFFTEFLRRVKEGFVSKRVAKVEEVLPRDVPTELVVEIIDEFVGTELWGDTVLGMWPAEVMRIPSKIAQKLHEKQGKEFEQILEQKLMADEVMPAVDRWLKEVGARVEFCAAQQGREVHFERTSRSVKFIIDVMSYRHDLGFLIECRQKEDGPAVDKLDSGREVLRVEVKRYADKVWNLLKRRIIDLGFKIEIQQNSQGEESGVLLSW